MVDMEKWVDFLQPDAANKPFFVKLVYSMCFPTQRWIPGESSPISKVHKTGRPPLSLNACLVLIRGFFHPTRVFDDERHRRKKGEYIALSYILRKRGGFMSTAEPHLDPDRGKEASGQIWIYSAIHFFRGYQLLPMLLTTHSCTHKLCGGGVFKSLTIFREKERK